ncbi:MAG: hypothetical protein JJ975_15070 [Bacteroidia bacterium]|nr:hypothetical protein [Bacteroidia bacterium]
MLKELFTRAFIAAIFLIPFSANGQIEIKLSNLPEGELQPGSTHTIVLNLQNSSSDTLTLKLKKKLDRPLRALIFAPKIVVYPNKPKNVLIPISIPRTTGSGEYNMSFTLLDNGKSVGSQKTKFSIAKITDIKVDLISRPTYARSIDTINARFMIINDGNAREQLTMRSENGLIRGPNIISIPPDSTIFVDLRITNDPKTYEVEDQLIDLFCQISGLQQSVGDQEIIKVYPARTLKIDPFFRFPVTTNFNYITQNINGEYVNSLFQFQITGKGPLDVDKKHHVNFSYRGPGAVRITRLGNFSQKFVGYTGPKLDVFIGEKTFGLSELTENFRFGTGLDIGARPTDKLAVRAYYNRPIFQPEIREQVGSSVSYSLKKKYTYQVNTLNNMLREGQTINLTSLGVNFTNYDDWRFNAEVSRSFSNLDDGMAFRYNTNWSAGKFKFSSNGLYADKKFQGYYNNSLFVGLNAGYNLKRIGFQVNGNYNNARPNLDTVFSIAPITFFTSAGIIAKPTRSLNIQFHGLYREKTNRLASQNFDYSEERLRLTFNYKRGQFATRLLTEAGNTYNNVSTAIARSFGYDAQLQMSYRPRESFGMSLFSQFLSNTRFTNELTQYLLYGVDAYYKYRKRLSASVEFQNNYLIEDLYNDRNLFNFRFGYQITPGQKISLAANYGILHQTPIRREWFLSANYLMKLGIPMIRLTELGSLKGQLINAGVESVDNVVLMMDGQLVTTDAEGFFRFNNVRPGPHHLFIDRATIGVRDLPDTTLPIEVTIVAEETVNIGIRMTKSAKVTGKIDLDKSVRTVQSSKQEVQFPSIIVEASYGDESLLTRADGEGNFVFGSLRPGTWKFRMVPTYWKDDFVVKKPYIMVDLEAAEEKHINMVIAPKVRQIRFLNTKKIKVGGK